MAVPRAILSSRVKLRSIASIRQSLSWRQARTASRSAGARDETIVRQGELRAQTDGRQPGRGASGPVQTATLVQTGDVGGICAEDEHD